MSLGLFDVDDRFLNRACGSSTKTWISFGSNLKSGPKYSGSLSSKQASPHLVTLRAVRGDGTVFPVEIVLDTYVYYLQDAIYYKEQYDRCSRFAPSGLTLYLAKKANGQWLKDDYDVDITLRGRRDSQYAEMHACWKLNDPMYFGTDFESQEGEIHVLAQLPQQSSRKPVTCNAKATISPERSAAAESVALAAERPPRVAQQATPASAQRHVCMRLVLVASVSSLAVAFLLSVKVVVERLVGVEEKRAAVMMAIVEVCKAVATTCVALRGRMYCQD